MTSLQHLLFPSAALLVLAACTERVEAPTAAIALVNEDAIVAGDLVVLDGSGSADAAENAEMELGFSYAWFLVSIPPGSEAYLNRTDIPVVSFVADAYGDYEVGLVVSNGVLTSPQATETVTVTACGHEAPLVASITATPAAPITAQVFQLSAAVSDPDETCIDDLELSYAWALTSVPAGSVASLNDPHLVDPSLVGDRPGDYTVELVVTDEIGLSSEPAELVVTVSDCGDAIPSVDTVDQEPDPAYAGDRVTLDLAVSDADIDTCLLDQGLQVQSAFLARPAGSNAVLAPAEGLEPAFIADVSGTYAVRTTVTDSTGRSSFEDTDITVQDCGAATPTVDTVVATPAAPLQLDAVALTITVSDADVSDCRTDQVLTVSSEIVARPIGSSAVLDPADGLAPAFLADAAGPFVVRTTVTDDSGLWSFRDTVIDVDSCGAAVPYVAGVYWEPQPAFQTDQIDLDLTVMDDDLPSCRPGQVVGVDSALLQRPGGSSAS
ncbi:MAG: hypothetical protein JRJ84_21745, partial [Deltaproteobacteria bacterium]|nr:hypothetical protein [Deltaproteobacteria bacterium]